MFTEGERYGCIHSVSRSLTETLLAAHRDNLYQRLYLEPVFGLTLLRDL